MLSRSGSKQRRCPTYKKSVEDDEFVDLIEDDLEESHDEQLKGVDLAENGAERYQDGRGGEVGVDKAVTSYYEHLKYNINSRLF